MYRRKDCVLLHIILFYSVSKSPSEYAQSEVVSRTLMTEVGSFILFRKQEIDCACAIAVIILSSLNQPYWIPQAVAVPEAGAGRKIDFFGQKENERESEKENRE